MIDSRLGWGGCNAGRAGVVYNSPKHRGALDCLPFQGLRDDLEYKFLGCIQDHHQLRIAICGESATHFVRASWGQLSFLLRIGTSYALFITNRYFLRTRARAHMPMRIGPRTHIGMPMRIGPRTHIGARTLAFCKGPRGGHSVFYYE